MNLTTKDLEKHVAQLEAVGMDEDHIHLATDIFIDTFEPAPNYRYYREKGINKIKEE